MSPIESLLAQTMINVVRRLCRDKEKCEGSCVAGTKGRPDRCYECPMDDVDKLWDAMMGKEP